MKPHNAENDVTWEPTGWWRVTAPDGSIWCETSIESEARDATRPGDTLSRLFQRTEREWRALPPARGDDRCQTCGGPVEVREGQPVCVSGSYLPHPPTRVLPPGQDR